MDTVRRRSELKRKIVQILYETPDKELPKSFIVSDESGMHRYKVTVQVEDVKEFMDERGIKWIRARE